MHTLSAILDFESPATCTCYQIRMHQDTRPFCCSNIPRALSCVLFTGTHEYTDPLFCANYSSSSSKSVSSAGVRYCITPDAPSITRYYALSAYIVDHGIMLLGDAESNERSVSLYVRCTSDNRNLLKQTEDMREQTHN